MPPPPTTEFAPAKINLTLHVTGQRADGYHLLDSLVVFANVGDLLTVSTAETLTLTVTGPKASGVPTDGSNLVMKAANHLRALRNVKGGAAIVLEKHLPHGGGIGGGSSDAATTLRLLARLWGVTPLCTNEALPLGADVPVCMMAPAAMIMSGIGETLSPAPNLPTGWLVLVNPGIAVSTRAVFDAHDALHTGSGFGVGQSETCSLPLSHHEFSGWLRGQRNDLTKVATQERFAPVIGEILSLLRDAQGLIAADMSGSGSTCWGWFPAESDAHRAARTLGAANPDWWVIAARVLGPADQLIRATT